MKRTNEELNLELNEIIELCKKSDRRAQEKLFRTYYGKMFAVCVRYISDRDSAQEVVQEGFIKVFDNIRVFDHKGSFEGWMRRIMANCAIDAIRKKRKDTLFSAEDNDFKFLPEDENDQEDWGLTSIKAELALEAIEKLSPAYKMVFNLYVMENYSHKEIAELLGISEGTSKSNLAKAKVNLQGYLKKKFTQLTA